MDANVIFIVLVIAVVVMLFFSSLRFWFGFIIAMLLVWYFGENKIKSVAKDIWGQTKEVFYDVCKNLKVEEKNND